MGEPLLLTERVYNGAGRLKMTRDKDVRHKVNQTPDAWETPEGEKAGREQVETAQANLAESHRTGTGDGFGPMVQRIFELPLLDDLGKALPVTARDAVSIWKDEFPTFWMKGNRFYKPFSGIKPGEVGLIKLATAGEAALVSTGIYIIHSDETSFIFRTLLGHPLSGTVAFSAQSERGLTSLRIKVRVRTSDPLYEFGRLLGVGKVEEYFWLHSIQAVGLRLGAESGMVHISNTILEPRLIWRNFGNIRWNAGLRSATQLALHPLRLFRQLVA